MTDDEPDSPKGPKDLLGWFLACFISGVLWYFIVQAIV